MPASRLELALVLLGLAALVVFLATGGFPIFCGACGLLAISGLIWLWR